MAHPSTAAARGYQPHSAENALKEIVKDAMEELFRVWDERFRECYGPLPRCIRTLLERSPIPPDVEG